MGWIKQHAALVVQVRMLRYPLEDTATDPDATIIFLENNHEAAG